MIKIIKFGSKTCGPCKMLDPHIKEITEEFKETVEVQVVDVDEDPVTAGKYGVMGIPRVMIFTEKEDKVHDFVGYRPKEQIIEMIESI